jgi:polar amino acid transport system substrate-binding protein
MKVIAGLLASVLALGLAYPSAAAELPERIKKAGKITVATMPNYAPITFKDPATNKLTGFDIDLGEALAKELGVGIEWQEIAFAQMIPSPRSRRAASIWLSPG